MKSILLFLSFVWISGCACAQAQTSGNPARPSYEERLDPWRASNRALDAASHGGRDAQIAMFLSAYVRLSQPYAGGEDLEQMRDDFKQLLSALGDDAFCRALSAQRPEVRSAVRWFFDLKTIQAQHPRAYRLLKGAPKIDWPTDKAYRED